MNKLIATLLLPMALAAPLYAQDQDPNQALPAGEPQASEDVEQTTAPPAREPGESPFDYEASEQISEDLSVSFPVDI